MQLIKCKNGHIYDADKLNNCPHCQGVVKNLDYEADTYGLDQSDVLTEVSESKGRENNANLGTRKHVGILVGNRGNLKGKTFILYEGVNRIGRAGNLEVCLNNEESVSRNGHAEIVYENGCFDLSPMKNDRIVLVNGERINDRIDIKDRDVLTIGECVLTFIKFDDVY